MLTKLGAAVLIVGALVFAGSGSAWAQLTGPQYDPGAELNTDGGYGFLQCGGPYEESGTCASANTVDDADLDGAQGYPSASYTFGPPSVSISSTYWAYLNGEGGSYTGGSEDYASLYYEVEYCDNPTCTPYSGEVAVDVDIDYNLSISTSATTGPADSPYVGFLPAAQAYVTFGEYGSQNDIADQDCLAPTGGGTGCVDGVHALTPTGTLTPGSDEIIDATMLPDEVYQVNIGVARGGLGTVNVDIGATVSTVGDETGTIVYSSGITPSVSAPEPASLPLFGAALFGLGAVRRLRRAAG